MYNEAISAWALQGFLLCSDATGLVGQDPPGGGGEMGQTDFYATVRGRLPVGRSNLPGILVENNFWAVRNPSREKGRSQNSRPPILRISVTKLAGK